MHKDHPEFEILRTKDLPYWRYMDLWKFLNLISTSKLYFPNFEMLGDQNEGRIPEKIYKMMLEEESKDGSEYATTIKNHIETKLRIRTLVSSWSACKTESFALWKMYAKEKLGIGIKSNYERLKKAFDNTTEDIYIGEVRYYDDKNPNYRIGNSFYTFLTKNNYYEFESEVRCITEVSHKEPNVTFKNIDVNLNDLIEEVYISPFAYEIGFIEIIEFIKSKNNLDFTIKVSGINDKWI